MTPFDTIVKCQHSQPKQFTPLSGCSGRCDEAKQGSSCQDSNGTADVICVVANEVRDFVEEVSAIRKVDRPSYCFTDDPDSDKAELMGVPVPPAQWKGTALKDLVDQREAIRLAIDELCTLSNNRLAELGWLDYRTLNQAVRVKCSCWPELKHCLPVFWVGPKRLLFGLTTSDPAPLVDAWVNAWHDFIAVQGGQIPRYAEFLSRGVPAIAEAACNKPQAILPALPLERNQKSRRPGSLMNKQTVAEQLEVSLSCLNALLRNGEISSYKVGRQVRFSQRHVDDYLARNEKEAKCSAKKEQV